MHHRFSNFWPGAHRCGGRHGRGGLMGGTMGGFAGRGDFGGHPFRSGRKLGAEDLQLLILSLLADKPAHGYEIIKSLAERSGGFYSPSPGMIYPALTYLEELGYAASEADGAKKRYSITDEGRAYLASHREAVDAIFAQLKWIGDKMEHVRRVFSGDREAESLFDDAREQLKSALMAKRGASEEEQLRIADILKRAADAIRGS